MLKHCIYKQIACSEFASYSPYRHPHNGTSQPIRGIGSVKCTSSLTQSSVLHVPSFPLNLLSVSSIIDQLDYRVLFDHESCFFQEKRTGRRLGTGISVMDFGTWIRGVLMLLLLLLCVKK